MPHPAAAAHEITEPVSEGAKFIDLPEEILSIVAQHCLKQLDFAGALSLHGSCKAACNRLAPFVEVARTKRKVQCTSRNPYVSQWDWIAISLNLEKQLIPVGLLPVVTEPSAHEWRVGVIEALSAQ